MAIVYHPARWPGGEEGISFRKDIEQFVSHEAVEAVTIANRIQPSPVRGVQYRALCDPSGGSSDSMTARDCSRRTRRPADPRRIARAQAAIQPGPGSPGIRCDR